MGWVFRYIYWAISMFGLWYLLKEVFHSSYAFEGICIMGIALILSHVSSREKK